MRGVCAGPDRPRKRARITRGSLVGSTEGLQLEIGILGACDDAGHEFLEVRSCLQAKCGSLDLLNGSVCMGSIAPYADGAGIPMSFVWAPPYPKEDNIKMKLSYKAAYSILGVDVEAGLQMNVWQHLRQVVAAAPVGACREVHNTYGELGNAELVAKYGFALRCNPFDAVRVGKAALVDAAAVALGPRACRAHCRFLAAHRCSKLPPPVGTRLKSEALCWGLEARHA